MIRVIAGAGFATMRSTLPLGDFRPSDERETSADPSLAEAQSFFERSVKVLSKRSPSRSSKSGFVTSAIVGLFFVCMLGSKSRGQSILLPTVDPQSIVVPTGSQTLDDGWRHYLALWDRLHSDTDVASARRLLGLPLSGPRRYHATRRGQIPDGLHLKRGSVLQVRTPLLTLDSTADEDQTLRIVEELHEAYWSWTQIFFPLWHSADSISSSLANGIAEDQISKRGSIRRPPMRVMLLRDAGQYASVLSRIDGIKLSTGYYDPTTRRSYFYVGQDATLRRSRIHEWTHQLFAESTRRSRKSASAAVGERSDFWLVEGIAGYMESLDSIESGQQVVGGWDSSRLQYSRHRLVQGEPPMPLRALRTMGRGEVQGLADLPRWYSDSITWTHQLMARPDTRQWLFAKLAQLYDIKYADSELAKIETDDSLQQLDIESFLLVDDARLLASPSQRSITELCLSRCNVTSAGLASIRSGSQLRWVDLSGCRVDDSDIGKLLGRGEQLEEIDLTQTLIGDRTIAALDGERLRILYATATAIGDESVRAILDMPKLETVDVQATAITDAAIEKLRRSRPQLTINPLQIVRQ